MEGLHSSPGAKALSFCVLRFLLALVEEAIDILLTLLTRKGRLERALLGVYEFRAAQMEQIEKCTVRHRGLRLRKDRRNIEQSEEILKKESVRTLGQGRVILRSKLCEALSSLAAYDALCEKVEVLRMKEYIKGNPAHEMKLLQLWHLLKPDEEISACFGKHWRTIGFQSDDPSRDFRGMGLLSLEQLIYMAKYEPRIMRSIVTLSNHPKIGFPFVITGINMTSLCHHLLKEGLLKNHFHNSSDRPVEMEDFHDAYCRIFALFAEFWKKENPPSIMSFNNVRMNFERILIPQLGKECNHLGNISF